MVVSAATDETKEEFFCVPSSSINDPQLPSHAPTAEATERRLLNFCQLPFPSSQMALIKSETEKKPSSPA